MPLTAVLLLLAARSLSVPQEQAVPATPASAVERPFVAQKKWALCIGAGAYTDLAPLKYSPEDARAFAGVLKEGYGFEPSTIGLISDSAAKAPTSANILGELDRLLVDKRLDRGDLFVFYFSGHGVGKPSGDYLMPTDVAEKDAERLAIPVKSLIERFVKAGLKNVLVIADACRSGAQNPFGRELQDLGRKANIAVLLGCAPGQRSYEYPRLGKGVFTHFLVKAMTDRSLADKGTGALWASAVAKQVTANVKEYTTADYGDDAQVPAAWSEPAQDVLFAAYPPENGESGEWLKETLRIEGSRLKPEPYGRFLSAMGQVLAGQGRRPEAIDAFKTLDGLGLATWRDLAALGFALKAESREVEIGSLVARAAREPAPTDHTEFLIVQGRPDYVGAKRYEKAVARIVRPETYGFEGAKVLTTIAYQRLGWSDARLGKELLPYLPLVPKESPAAMYLAAFVALGEGKYSEAIERAKAASDGPRGQELRADLRHVRLRAAEALKDKAAADAILAEGEADASDSYPWAIERLRRMKATDDPGFADAARALAANTESVPRFTDAMMLLGGEAGSLLSDAERLAARYPFSSEAAVNVWLAQAVKAGFLPVEPIPKAAFKYAPDRKTLITSALFRYDGLVESARESGKINGWRAGHIRGDLVGYYALYRADILDDPIALSGMGLALLRTTQVVRQGLFVKTILWPLAQKADYGRHELTLTSLYLALNASDEPLAKEIFESARTQGFLAPGSIMRYALHQAVIGELPEAERALALWKEAGGESTNRRMREYFVSTQAVIAAQRSQVEKVSELLKGIERADEISGPLAYYALYLAKGRRGLSKEYVAALGNPTIEYSDLHVAMLAAAFDEVSKDDTENGRAVRATLSTLLAEYPGHPWTSYLGFNNASDFASFAGRTVWKGTAYDGVGSEPVVLTLAITKHGRVEGKVELQGTKETYRVVGTVDNYGNLAVPLHNADDKVVADLFMKLPNIGFERGDPKLKANTFRAEMIGNVWNVLQFDLKLAESEPLPPNPPLPDLASHD